MLRSMLDIVRSLWPGFYRPLNRTLLQSVSFLFALVSLVEGSRTCLALANSRQHFKSLSVTNMITETIDAVPDDMVLEVRG